MCSSIAEDGATHQTGFTVLLHYVFQYGRGWGPTPDGFYCVITLCVPVWQRVGPHTRRVLLCYYIMCSSMAEGGAPRQTGFTVLLHHVFQYGRGWGPTPDGFYCVITLCVPVWQRVGPHTRRVLLCYYHRSLDLWLLHYVFQYGRGWGPTSDGFY